MYSENMFMELYNAALKTAKVLAQIKPGEKLSLIHI